MTLAKLLQYLDQNTSYGVLSGTPDETLARSRRAPHDGPLLDQIVRSIADGNQCVDAGSAVLRAESITALGPIRLRYMKDDAPVDSFRMVERIIHTIDSAFNDEALHEKRR